MRVLITGAAGFLGSHLCDKFLAEGHEVVGMDNFVTGKRENLTHLGGEERFLFIRHDVSEYIFVPGKIDAVLHFASPASPNPNSPFGYFNLPIQTMKAGALGTHNTLGVAKAQNAKYLLASTSEIYGNPEVHPQKESYWGNVDPISPRSVYDEAKRFAESLTMAYHRFHHVDSRIVRIFNTYGPRMQVDDGRVVPNFISQAIQGDPLTVYGDGQQTRSFCYVDDLVDGIYALLMSNEHYPVNIGNPHEVTVLEFANIINELTRNKAGVRFFDDRRTESDPERRQPDITRAKEILNWVPQVPLEEGLLRTIDYVREALKQA
ncbi:SDR family oxidoreductase [bacterium]|nr:SDR family oxidoreductase [bacterium]